MRRRRPKRPQTPGGEIGDDAIMADYDGELTARIGANVPDEMTKARRWVLWRYEERDGRPQKVPCQPGGRRAKSDDPDTWRDLVTVLTCYDKDAGVYDGVGFVLGAGWWGIDVDRPALMHPNPTGDVFCLGAYVEESPSGAGYHVMGYDPTITFEHQQIPELDADGNPIVDETGHRVMTEFYAYPDQVGGRYFTVTGQMVPYISDEPASVAQNVRDFCETVWKVNDGRSPEPAQGDDMDVDDPTDGAGSADDPELMSALDAIDPAGLTYDEWLAVGMELKARGYDVSVWDEWSSKDQPRYHKGECAMKWGGLHPKEAGKKIFSLAYERGWYWNPPDNEPADDAEKKPAWIRMSDFLAPGGPWDVERKKRDDLGLVGTGWKEFDAAIGGGLTPDLYLMGGAPGTGKTTIAWQMCDQVAAQGWPAVYVCTEQGAYELACKSVARTAYLSGATSESDKHPMTALGLIQGYWPTTARAMADEYLESNTPRVIQCDYDESIENVARKLAVVERAVRKSGDERPLFVVIDYLQLLRSDAAGKNVSEREITDCKVRALKAMQRNDGDPRIMLVLSSFGRDAYRDVSTTAPTMAAYKESGSVEYAAAVCIALWRFAGIKKKGDWLVEPDQDDPEASVIRARIVKNRYGRADRTVWMKHVKLFDYVETMTYKDMQARGLVAEGPDDDQDDDVE